VNFVQRKQLIAFSTAVGLNPIRGELMIVTCHPIRTKVEHVILLIPGLDSYRNRKRC